MKKIYEPLQLGILINPKAGKKREKSWRRIIGYAVEHQIPYKITQEVEDIWEAITYLLLRCHVNKLAVVGGDGTFQKVMDALNSLLVAGLIKDLPIIVLLGGGTLKSVLYLLHWWLHTPLGILKKVVRRLKRGQELPCRHFAPLEIRFGPEVHFGYIILGGVLYDLSRDFGSGEKTKIVYAKKVIKSLLAALNWQNEYSQYMRSRCCRIRLDQLPINQKEQLGFIASSTDELYIGIRPFTSTAQGKIFFLSSSLTAKQIFWRVIFLARGWIKRNPRVINRVADQIVMHADDLAFSLDGETFYPGAKQVTITLAKLPIRLVENF